MPSVIEAWKGTIKFNWAQASAVMTALIDPKRNDGEFPWQMRDIKAIPVLIGEQGIGKTERIWQIGTELAMEFLSNHVGARAFEDALGLPGREEDPKNPGHHKVLPPPNFPSNAPKKGKHVRFLDGTEQRYEGSEKHLVWVDAKNQKDGEKHRGLVIEYGGYGIYFHDEIMTADTDKQSQIRDMIDNRRVGMLPIADGWFQVGATNPPTKEFLTVKRTDQALEDRYLYIPVMPDWTEAIGYWELNKLVPATLIHYLLWRGAEGFFGGEKGESRLSPRRWVSVGNMIDRMQKAGNKPDAVADAIAVNLTPSHAAGFKKFLEFGEDQTKYPLRPNMMLNPDKVKDNVKVIKYWKEHNKHALLNTSILALRAWGNAAKDKPGFSLEDKQVDALATYLDDQLLGVDTLQDLLHVFGASSIGPELITRMRCSEDIMKKLCEATAIERGQKGLKEDN